MEYRCRIRLCGLKFEYASKFSMRQPWEDEERSKRWRRKGERVRREEIFKRRKGKIINDGGEGKKS